ncbi:LLM class flavin-dependent oxidoreductase [Fodinicola acaciae]|uniref:LLM class flavin-dependent oxidoreductase n=1 Tax=Fodinicola acaciae TaxID=2681555 RepID=UPI0013D54D6B|nr:LLM class flavin-dependent oxidoreductase [Fodinicola acaciae]
MTRINVGTIISSVTPPQEVRPRARHAERAGLDSIFSGDHLAATVPTLDSVVSLTTSAAVTERIEVGFGVMVLPLRHVAWVAKQIATMQQISGDRVILGVGSGGEIHGNSAWNALGIPYAERGRQTDEALAALPDLIAGKPAEYNGQRFAPTPAATVPHIAVGGRPPVALRRAAQYGDSWFPSLVTPADVRAGADKLEELAATYDRKTPEVIVGGTVGLGVTPAEVDRAIADLGKSYAIPPEKAAEVVISGTPQQAADRFHAYAEAGATHLVMGTFAADWYAQADLLAEARALLG